MVLFKRFRNCWVTLLKIFCMLLFILNIGAVYFDVYRVMVIRAALGSGLVGVHKSVVPIEITAPCHIMVRLN